MPNLFTMPDAYLEAERRTLAAQLEQLDQAPKDVPLPDEWFVAWTAASERLHEIEWELLNRHPEQRLAAIAL